MKLGDTVSTIVISTGKYKGYITKEVVVKTFIGRIRGVPKYDSKIKHIRE